MTLKEMMFANSGAGMQSASGIATGFLDAVGGPSPEMGMLKGGLSGAAAGAALGPVGAAVGGAVGLATGYMQALKEKNRMIDMKNARTQFARDAMKGEKTSFEDSNGQTSQMYRNGGSISLRSLMVKGGRMQPLSERMTEVKGNTHEQGGIDIQEFELEDGEVIHNNEFVFSDKLGFSGPAKKLGKAAGIIESKPLTKERQNSLRDINKRTEDLKVKQELFKKIAYGG